VKVPAKETELPETFNANPVSELAVYCAVTFTVLFGAQEISLLKEIGPLRLGAPAVPAAVALLQSFVTA
jgi:hypothetical protein